MTHAIIIRFHYKDNDPRFQWRLAYFQAMVLPRILRQTKKNFDIAVRCNPKHADIFQKMNRRIRTFTVSGEKESHIIRGGKKYFIDFVPWKDVIGLEKYDIQTGIDSDDLISENFIERIENEIRQRNPNKSLHVSFQPGIFNAATLQKYPMKVSYGEKKGSAFFSIYQPNKKKYIFAYEDSHLRLWKYFDKSVTIPYGYCWATVHGFNESTNAKT